ncbi:MAG: hypothetical protein J5644_09230, partial [Bacteroidales bacterium]|nr:hypothetical protein [Bacteroidales bacterium]
MKTTAILSKANLSGNSNPSRLGKCVMLFALMLSSLLPAGVKAQNYSTIGNESNTSVAVPVNNYWNYTWTQMIYTSDELQAGTISSIGFQYAYGSPSTEKNDVQIYMGTTNKSYFSDEYDYVTSGLTLVYNGSLNCTEGWNDFQITPYTYSGNGNLIVAVVDQSGAYDDYSYTFYYSTTSNAMTINYYEDDYYSSSPYAPNFDMYCDGVYYYRPNTRFAITSQGSGGGGGSNNDNVVNWGSISDYTGITSYSFSPYGRHYGWEYKVYCYRPGTLPFSGDITSMAFLAATDYATAGTNTSSSITVNGSTDSNPLQIWMKEVDANFSLNASSTFSTYVTGATKVYSGNNPVTTNGQYTTFPLSTNFSHSEENSLLIMVRTVATSTSGCGAHEAYYKTFNAGANIAWFNKSDGSDPGINTNSYYEVSQTELPVLRVTYENNCARVTSPSNGTSIYTSSTTATWNAVDGATGYHIYLSDTPVKPDNYTYSTTSTSQLLSNLSYGVNYLWVTPYQGNAEVTGCDDYVSFTSLYSNSVSVPTITANADLNNLICGQSVTLTANGDADDYLWFSDAACTHQVGTGRTYTFQAGEQPVTVYCVAKQVITPYSAGSQGFSYTGSAQTYNIPAGAQSLTLEVWGAQGGGNQTNGNSSAGVGGLGGYSVGTMPVMGGETIYVYVGGEGNESSGYAQGGYNGGGTNYGSGSGEPGCGGGGATDIRLNGTTLYDRIIVAGGGGGGGEDNGDAVGAGGGETSTVGYSSSYQASQTAGGTGGVFGIGASSPNDGGAGGGGWYGGGTNGGSQTIPSSYTGTDCQGGGGGSGYVWTSATASYAPVGYNVPASYYLSNAQTIAGNISFPAPGGGTETGHQGNGYARISYEIPEVLAYSSAVSVTAGVGTPPSTPVVEVFNACPGNDVTLTVTNAVEGITYGWWNNSSCSGTPLYEGNSYTIYNMQSNATYYVRAYNGTYVSEYDFAYTGSEQMLYVPSNVGSVTLQVWGAQGGGQQVDGNTSGGEGGKGGYSIGTMPISSATTLYIYVGGQGGTSRSLSSTAAPGGWNGGGTAYGSDSSDPACGGGGATDIRVNGSTLYDRIIVAGGGGGG